MGWRAWWPARKWMQSATVRASATMALLLASSHAAQRAERPDLAHCCHQTLPFATEVRPCIPALDGALCRRLPECQSRINRIMSDCGMTEQCEAVTPLLYHKGQSYRSFQQQHADGGQPNDNFLRLACTMIFAGCCMALSLPWDSVADCWLCELPRLTHDNLPSILQGLFFVFRVLLA